MSTSANDIIANFRRARQAVRGLTPQRRSQAAAPPPVIVPLPDAFGPRNEDGVTDEQPVLRRPPTVRAIIEAVAQAYDVSPLDIASQRRTRELIEPRHLVMYLARHFTTRSLPEIGRRLGGKDHATVIWGVRAIAGRLAGRPPVAVDRRTTLAELVSAHRDALESVR